MAEQDTPPSGTPVVEPESPAEADAAARQNGDPFAQRPELFVGAAFVGGLVLAQILKRIGR
jgi:hypothetical protein